MFDNWFRYLKSLVFHHKTQKKSTASKVNRRSFRPHVEPLEDRWTPAALDLSGKSLVYTAGATHYVLDGVTTRFDPTQYSSIQFLGHGGSANLTGYKSFSGQASNTATVRPGWAQLASTTGNHYTPIVLTNVLNITIHGSTSDVASLSDTNGSTVTFNGTPSRSWLQGSDYLNQVLGFGKVYAMAGASSNDTAYFSDQGGPSSTFNATPAHSYLVNNYGILTEAIGYKSVYATAAAGNSDNAYLTGGVGSNSFNGTPTRSVLTGTGFSETVISFAQVHATASNYNSDIAYLSDVSGNNTFNGTAANSWLVGKGYLVDVVYFPTVRATAAAGTTDIAYLAGAGTYVAGPKNTWLKTNGYLMDAVNFWRVYHAA